MKAIFAVTALAAAISGQALAADTEATTTFSGSMDAYFEYDLNEDPATVDVNQYGDTDEDQEGYDLTMEIGVVNGPFSATIATEYHEGVVTLEVNDIIVTDGKLSFGQVGNLMETDAYVDGSVGMSDDSADTAAVALDDDIGFRYVAAEGLTLQLGGVQNDPAVSADKDMYLAAQYMGSADALSYIVEGEMKLNMVDSDGGADAPMFIGAGVTYTADVATVTAGYNMVTDATGNSDSEYAVDVQSTLGDATIGLGYYEPSTEGDDDEELVAEIAYAIDSITLSAGYTFTTPESAGDELTAGVAWAEDMLSASADVTIANFDADTADDALIELNVTYTTEAGIEYYADYAMQSEAVSLVTLGGRYAF